MDKHVFIRRGTITKGPLPLPRVLVALQSGELRPTDEVATSSNGPWRRLQDFTQRRPDLPTVEKLDLKRRMMGRGYFVTYACPACSVALESDESEWGGIETCPTCGKRYRISAVASQRADEARARIAAERQQAAEESRLAQERRRAADEHRRRQRAEVLQQKVAAFSDQQKPREPPPISARLARSRGQTRACWYCCQPLLTERPQCCFCRMLNATPA
jgi:hypothetical protein